MSLLDALLLESYRTDVYVAQRADGNVGSGTAADPYDGSTPSKFEAVMNGLAEYTRVNLGPGTFQTVGYSDSNPTAGWQPKAGMKIVGAGIDVTTLQLVGSGTANQHYYAVGHELASSANPGRVDFFEISDLTIDCNLRGTGTQLARGAIRVKGNHARIRRVKVKDWGTKGTNRCYVITVITADPGFANPIVIDPGIEDCIAVEPFKPAVGTAGPATILHAGLKEGGYSTAESFGEGPWIRNCYIDCRNLADATLEADIVALSMSWCLGGLVEGNQVFHVRVGGAHQTTTKTYELIVRNNFYKNVWRGPYFDGSTPNNFELGQLIIEGNVVELLGSTDEASPAYAIDLWNGGCASRIFIKAIIRNNKIRYLDGVFNASYTGKALRLAGTENAIVENNVLDVAPANPLWHEHCNNVKYFNNTTPAGKLIQGYNQENGRKTDELETAAEDALLMSLMAGEF